MGELPYAGCFSVLGSDLRESDSDRSRAKDGGVRLSRIGEAVREGRGRMIRVTGVGRRMLIGAVGLCAMGLGWLLLYEVTSPGVAARLSTAPLAAVIALQVLPVLGWLAWRVDRAAVAEAAGVRAETGVAAPAADVRLVHADERPARFSEVVPVHRVVHVTRTRPRSLARAGDEAVAR